MVYIGIDVGATTIKIGIVDQHGSILVKDSCLTLVRRGYQAMVDDMVNLSKKLLSESGHTMADVHSVGIGIPGMQDMRTHRVPFCTNLQWHDVPLEEIMRERMGVPVYVNNDANVAALAEAKAGATKNVKNSVVVTLGTGVGGGVILGGKLFCGADGMGTELGHTPLISGGYPCTCGIDGCLEAYASVTALIRQTKEAMAAHPESLMHAYARDNEDGQVTGKTAFESAKQGDPAALAVVDRYEDYLANGIGGLVNIFRPEMVLIGGGLSAQDAYLLDPLNEKAKRFVFASGIIGVPPIRRATLGNAAGTIGAANLDRM